MPFKIYDKSRASKVLKEAGKYIEKKQNEVDKGAFRELERLLEDNIGKERFKALSKYVDLKSELLNNRNDVQKTYRSVIEKNFYADIAMSADGSVAGWRYVLRSDPQTRGEWKHKAGASPSWNTESYAKIQNAVLSSLGNILPADYGLSETAEYKMRAYLLSDDYKKADRDRKSVV